MKITHYLADRAEDDSPVPLAQLLAQDEGALWVDMTGPTDDDLRTLREVFHFHPLAIEDTTKQRQRPKLEEYEGYFFLTMHAVHPSRQTSGQPLRHSSGQAGRDRTTGLVPDQPASSVGAPRKGSPPVGTGLAPNHPASSTRAPHRVSAPDGTGLAWSEIDIFFGPRYVVTVHPEAVPALDEARARLTHAHPQLRTSADYVLYAIVDTAVDSYFPVIDRLDASLERLEDQLFREPTARTLDHIFALKRTLLQMRRVAAPLRDLLNGLTRRDLPLVRPQTVVYFRDVFDHLLRITDMIDTHRDLITGALDIYLSVISNRLNEVMRVLTVITAVFASLAVISGIYGMNFQQAYPPFDWPYGFAAVLLGMGGITAVMLALFRRQGWL